MSSSWMGGYFSVRWVICLSPSNRLAQASSHGAPGAAIEGKFIFRPLFTSCLLMPLNYSKSHELRSEERDSLIGGVEICIAKEHIQEWMKFVAFLKLDT